MSKDYSQEEILEVLKDAGLSREDLDILVSSLEVMTSAHLNSMAIADDLEKDDGEMHEIIKRIQETLEKIRRAQDVAYPPANRLDNQEKGFGEEQE